jgi:hypothetical protein
MRFHLLVGLVWIYYGSVSHDTNFRRRLGLDVVFTAHTVTSTSILMKFCGHVKSIMRAGDSITPAGFHRNMIKSEIFLP